MGNSVFIEAKLSTKLKKTLFPQYTQYRKIYDGFYHLREQFTLNPLNLCTIKNI